MLQILCHQMFCYYINFPDKILTFMDVTSTISVIESLFIIYNFPPHNPFMDLSLTISTTVALLSIIFYQYNLSFTDVTITTLALEYPFIIFIIYHVLPQKPFFHGCCLNHFMHRSYSPFLITFHQINLSFMDAFFSQCNTIHYIFLS